MHIFILCGGSGAHLNNDIYPKPLNLINGKPLIFWCLNSITDIQLHNVHIVFNKNLKLKNFESILKYYCNDSQLLKKLNIHFYELEYFTRGALESFYIGLLKSNINDDESVIVIDNDNLYNIDINDLKYIYSKNFLCYSTLENPDPIYSFLKIKNNILIDYKEKEKISNDVCNGIYGFANVGQTKTYIQDILLNQNKIKNEFYISNFFIYLLSKNINIYTHKLSNCISLGTSEQIRENYHHLPKLKLKFVFDIDNTILTYPCIKSDYSTNYPNTNIVDFIKYLKNNGHYIIINTARRQASSNEGSSIKQIGKSVFENLDRCGIEYDELLFSKPYADYYIDDKGFNTYQDNLFEKLGFFDIPDFNILNVLSNNKFNNLQKINDNIIIKSGQYLEGQIFFYEQLSKFPTLLSFFPTFYEKINSNTFKLELIKSIPISNLYISQLLSINQLENILKIIQNIHNTHNDITINYNDLKHHYIDKLISRFNPDYYYFDNAKHIFNILHLKLSEYIDHANIVGIIHGDCWFANILLTYDDNYKFIDMRGLINNVLTLNGDSLYDYAKLYQSLLNYDSILFSGKRIFNDYHKNYINYYKSYLIKNNLISSINNLNLLTAYLIFGTFPFLPITTSDSQKQEIWSIITDLISELNP
jgi:dTDP-glucose pyrophosphorylase